MGYAYTLLGVNDDGESIVELEVSADDAVILLARALATRPAAAPVQEEREEEVAPNRTYTKRGTVEKIGTGAYRHAPRVPKPCCGSTGSRHFKTCTQYGKSVPTDP